MTPNITDEQRKYIKKEAKDEYPFLKDDDPATVYAVDMARNGYQKAAEKYIASCNSKEEIISKQRLALLAILDEAKEPLFPSIKSIKEITIKALNP